MTLWLAEVASACRSILVVAKRDSQGKRKTSLSRCTVEIRFSEGGRDVEELARNAKTDDDGGNQVEG